MLSVKSCYSIQMELKIICWTVSALSNTLVIVDENESQLCATEGRDICYLISRMMAHCLNNYLLQCLSLWYFVLQSSSVFQVIRFSLCYPEQSVLQKCCFDLKCPVWCLNLPLRAAFAQKQKRVKHKLNWTNSIFCENAVWMLNVCWICCHR